MSHVLLAPDKFKGTLSAAEVAGHLAAGLAAAAPGTEVVTVPVADGGEGTLAAAAAAGFDLVPVEAGGPTGMPCAAAYARRGTEAVLELAAVSGLAQLPGGRTDALAASSRGTGEVLAAALDAGCTSIVVGIGGSACTDGGAGLLQALGAEVTDAAGRPVPPGGAGLAQAAHLDLSGLAPRVAAVDIVVACDVDNPLTGPRGAAAVYGPQKGADPGDVALLDAALSRWADVVAAATGHDLREVPGAGAAGGVGFAAVAVLGARLRPGAELLFERTGFHQALAGAALVVTGEGSLDEQTLHGKAPAQVAAAASAAGVPVIAVAGRRELSLQQCEAAGFAAVFSLAELAGDPEESFTRAGPLLEQVGARIAGCLDRAGAR